jgi:uncharacterized protein (TIGR03437 family)
MPGKTPCAHPTRCPALKLQHFQWTNSDLVGGNLPTELDGVSANVNGIPAYVYYISPHS